MRGKVARMMRSMLREVYIQGCTQQYLLCANHRTCIKIIDTTNSTPLPPTKLCCLLDCLNCPPPCAKCNTIQRIDMDSPRLKHVQLLGLLTVWCTYRGEPLELKFK